MRNWNGKNLSLYLFGCLVVLDKINKNKVYVVVCKYSVCFGVCLIV